MALTRLKIEFLVRNTRFMLDGKLQNLKGDAGYEAIDENLLWDIINTCVADTNMDLDEDKQEQTTNCVVNSDEIVPPSDVLSVSQVVIYPDYDDSASPSGTSSYSKGDVLKKVTDYSVLTSHTALTLDHGINANLDDTAGKPSAWMLWRRDNQDVIKFDIRADHGYYVDILYWTVPATLTTDDSNPEVRDIYQWLIVDLVRQEVANLIGDERAFGRFSASYQRRLLRYKNAKGRDFTPDTVRVNTNYL